MYTYIYAVYMQMVYTVYIHEDQYIDIRYKYRDKLKFIHTHTFKCTVYKCNPKTFYTKLM